MKKLKNYLIGYLATYFSKKNHHHTKYSTKSECKRLALEIEELNSKLSLMTKIISSMNDKINQSPIIQHDELSAKVIHNETEIQVIKDTLGISIYKG